MTPLQDSPPHWYQLYCRFFWPVWLAGLVLIGAHWTGLLPRWTGWCGLVVVTIASLGTRVAPYLAGVTVSRFVVLDPWPLKCKSNEYGHVLNRFSEGASLYYDGVAFSLRPNNDLAVAYSTEVDERNDDLLIRNLAEYAKTVYDDLISSSPEFAATVTGRTPRFHVLAGRGRDMIEVCRLDDLKWQSMADDGSL